MRDSPGSSNWRSCLEIFFFSGLIRRGAGEAGSFLRDYFFEAAFDWAAWRNARDLLDTKLSGLCPRYCRSFRPYTEAEEETSVLGHLQRASGWSRGLVDLQLSCSAAASVYSWGLDARNAFSSVPSF